MSESSTKRGKPSLQRLKSLRTSTIAKSRGTLAAKSSRLAVSELMEASPIHKISIKPKTKRRLMKERPGRIKKYEELSDDGHFHYSVEERVFDEKFDRAGQPLVVDLTPADFTLHRLLTKGLTDPLVFRKTPPAGMCFPKDLCPQMVAEVVGKDVSVEVINCANQEGVQMKLGHFVKYFGTPTNKQNTLRHHSQTNTYNLIDLEVSDTALSKLIQAPLLVRQIDWATNVWPANLRANAQTNHEKESTYPKTQKYVLMSKAGCFTDFHIDFGGSSVWYHIVQGKKIFFLIPPSQKNRNIFAQWVLSGQNLRFLGDEVDECERIEVVAGDTLIIPSGWIHAVYTMDDTVVVGGNFLHTFSAETQLEISVLEQALKVKRAIRYPFFQDLQWLALLQYETNWRNCKTIVNKLEHSSVMAMLNFAKESLDRFSGMTCPVAEKHVGDPNVLLAKLEVILNALKINNSEESDQFFSLTGINVPKPEKQMLPEQQISKTAYPPKTTVRLNAVLKKSSYCQVSSADISLQMESIQKSSQTGNQSSLVQPLMAEGWTQTEEREDICNNCHCNPRPWYLASHFGESSHGSSFSQLRNEIPTLFNYNYMPFYHHSQTDARLVTALVPDGPSYMCL